MQSTAVIVRTLSICSVMMLAALPACEPAAESVATGVDLTNPRDLYEGIRGRVTQLPAEGPPPLDLRISHEKITGFKNAAGDAVGMNAMIMDFPYAAAGVAIDSLSVGDRIAFDLAVRFDDGTPVYWIERMEILDAETAMDLVDEPKADAGGDETGVETE